MRKPIKIEEILPGIMQGLDEKTNKGDRLSKAWDEAAGKKIASHSRPVCIKEERLFVETDSSSWTHMAMMQRHDILDRLNAILKDEKIKKIMFKSSGQKG